MVRVLRPVLLTHLPTLHISHEAVEAQRRGRPQPVRLDYTPSLVPSPVLWPHLTSHLSISLDPVKGKARPKRNHRMGTGTQLSDSLLRV